MRRIAVTLIVLIFLCLLPGRSTRAGDDLRALLSELSGEEDPAARIALVGRLAARDSSSAAAALAKLIRTDPSPDVRTEAARGLARIAADNAVELMCGLLLEGGIRPVRHALAEGLAGHDAGVVLLKLLSRPQRSVLEKSLVIEALGSFTDPVTLRELLGLSTDADRHQRIAALRALSARKDEEEMLIGALRTVLQQSRDTSLLMAVLDLVRMHPDPTLIPGVRRVLTFPEPALLKAADHTLRQLAYEQWKRAGAAAGKEGYAPPGTPREPPGERPRFDLVYALDGTGSVTGRLEKIVEKIRERYRFLEELGSDVRVGIVVFRGHRTIAPAQVLPLSHDLAGIDDFLDEFKAGGADSQGAAVFRGLAEALDRMNWRWEARRAVFIVADSRCHDPARARAIAALHLAADRTRVHVLYLLRTRTKVPESIEELARVGGGSVEVIE